MGMNRKHVQLGIETLSRKSTSLCTMCHPPSATKCTKYLSFLCHCASAFGWHATSHIFLAVCYWPCTVSNPSGVSQCTADFTGFPTPLHWIRKPHVFHLSMNFKRPVCNLRIWFQVVPLPGRFGTAERPKSPRR